MIKYFAVENFRSIKEENIVEFDAGLSKESPFIANPTIGIAGANASGKSSLLQAINFTLWFMQNSFLGWDPNEFIPLEPFISCQDKQSKLHIIFAQQILVDKQNKYVDFEYILYATREKVITEELSYYPYKRKRLVYQRRLNKVKQGSTVNRLEKELWEDLRSNCSVVSLASQYGTQDIARECIKYRSWSNLSYIGLRNNDFHPRMLELLMHEHGFAKDNLIRFLKIADLGISNFEITQKDFVKYLFFKHEIDSSVKDFDERLESEGTRQFIAIMYEIIQSLSAGHLTILDEIEIKLHQNIVAYIIGLFQNKYENPHGAQLIFSFHNTYFMDILEPNQLWFTEKNDRGQTKIFSAADFKDIKKLQQRSLEELYRLGRFGAKPRGI
ncbi:MAG: ATP-binding protein [Cyanobacteria bacterium J06598_4]